MVFRLIAELSTGTLRDDRETARPRDQASNSATQQLSNPPPSISPHLRLHWLHSVAFRRRVRQTTVMTPRGVAWRFAILFWTIFGVLTGFQVWISMITHGHSVPRLIFYYVVVWEAWVGATAVIVWLLRRFPVIPARREILSYVKLNVWPDASWREARWETAS